ncbi:chaperonin 10-like protein [Bombardia bombarda]|uniref:Chaperonin 10-like protein n=1 Tax=Bombardia bombarda TaxID=252184 RepID=A0AA39TWA2_9PEZI|nr:chaperonin 10-like protein [Bombardia bombarda]
MLPHPLTTGFTSPAYVVYHPGGPITLEPVAYGPIQPDEIVLSTAAVSVCASDLKVAAGKFYCQPPMILGHECAGTVLAVGSLVRDLALGDRVILSYDSCKNNTPALEKCTACAEGLNPYCRDMMALNMTGYRRDGSVAAGSITTLNGDGEGKGVQLKGHLFGQSSMGRTILRLFASLGCGIQTGAGAVLNVARPKINSSICIFGAGSVGLSALMAAKLTSPSLLVVVDNSAAKLDMLPVVFKEGEVKLVDSSRIEGGETGLVERLKGMTGDGLGFDFVLDCVGRSEIIRVGHLTLRGRGMIVTVGGGGDAALGGVTMGQHLTRGITFRGTHQGDCLPWISLPLLIDLWRQGKFPFDKLLTFYKFEELHEAIQDLKDGKIIKPVLINDMWETNAQA